MSLNYQDVQELLKLLDESPYNELKLQTGSFTLDLQRCADGEGWQQASSQTDQCLDFEASSGHSTTTIQSEPEASETGLLDVRAPMIGTWYRAPTPGAEPFIETGSEVHENTVIGIIEAMKLMTSVPAMHKGTVVEILVSDATLIEKGQLLLRIRPQQ